MKNKYVAALLAVLLGGLGFHKFYLGKWFQGILYIVFMPITIFVSILEGIQYLLNSEEWFDNNFNFEYISRHEDLKRIRERNERMEHTSRRKVMN